MAREGLRRSTRASIPTSRAASAVTSPLSSGSDLDLPEVDSGEEYAASGGGEESDESEGELSPPPEESDEYEEEEEEKPKRGKGKAGTRAKGKATATGEPKTPKRKGPKPGKPKEKPPPRLIRSTAPREPGRRSTAAARSNSTLNAFPEAYRDLLLNSALTLVRKEQAEKAAAASFKVPPFPPGPVTPFVSALKRPPGMCAAEVETREDSPHAPHRREHMREVAKRVAIVPPWDAWMGEGWWPECAGAEAEEDADGPMEGWKWRGEVRLGLEDVGRYGVESILSASEGASFLPKGDDIVLDVYDGNDTTRHSLRPLESIPIENTISKGFALTTGAPTWGLDWCPYPESLAAAHGFEQCVAVSTIPPTADPVAGSRCAPTERGAIQIWSVPYVDDEHLPSQSPPPRCDIVLCVTGGPVSDLKWMPLGAWDAPDPDCVPKIGIVAAVHLDGSTALYAVPQAVALRDALPLESRTDSGPIFISAPPLARFAVADAAATCITWLSGHRIAVGLSNGHLAVWDAVDAMLSGEKPLPSMYTALALSSIRAVAAGRTPPTDGEGNLDYTAETPYLAWGAYDGSTGVVDLRDGHTTELNRSRLPCMATAWSTQLGVPLYADVDHMVLLAQLRASVGPATYYLTPHRGPVWDIATSDYHTMVASAGSDGSLLVSNCGMGFYRRKQGGMLFQRLYEIDFDEHAGSYRMTHDFLAEATGLEEATSKANHKNTRTKAARAEALPPSTGDPSKVKTGAWRRNVGIHRVAWSQANIARAGWVASAGYAGIVRVDNLRGKWLYQPK